MVDKARQAAVTLLGAVLEDGLSIAELLGPEGVLAPLEPGERARAQRLAVTTLRHLGPADALLKPLLRRMPGGMAQNVLRLGVIELMEEHAAAHGVVNSAVALLRAHQKTRAMAGMANAVLRKVAEMPQESWRTLPAQRLPGWLRGRLESTYKRAAVERIEAAHAGPVPLDLTARGDAAALAGATGGVLLPTGSVRLASGGQVTALPGYEAGDWWVQDAAAALPARILDARPGETVLDVCAAPGGKTMQLAAAGAQVTALDISSARLERLAENLTRTGLRADVVCADALEWSPPAPVDAVLLDAPCSATGTIRRHPDLPFAKTAKGVKPLFALQGALIDRALGWLKPEGRLVFCTCSLLPEEGEMQLARALERHTELAVDRTALVRPGIDPAWVDDLGGLRLRPDYWADTGGMDGFYVTVLRKRALNA